MSATARTSTTFHAGKNTRSIGRGHIPSLDSEEQERTGTIDNVNASNIQDPKGLIEEGYEDNINDHEDLDIPFYNSHPSLPPRRSARIAENLNSLTAIDTLALDLAHWGYNGWIQET